MTRAPLASLRRLFELGGSPAASHLALSRAPDSGRLLEPMARARIANDTSLDALARPLDVGQVLARMSHASAGARQASPPHETSPIEVAETDVPPRKARRQHGTTPTAPSKPAVEPEVSARPRARAVNRPAVDAVAVREAVARAFDDSGVDRVRGASAASDESRREPRFARHEPEASPRTRPFEHATAVSLASTRSFVARAGAHAPVVVERSVAEIDRLLAVAAPTARAPMTSATPVTSARRREPTVEGVPVRRDASRLLAGAVERALSRHAAPAPASAPAAANAAPKSQRATAPNTPQRVATQVAAPDIETSGGGFRGLAQRTLVASAESSTPVRRIEPERRTPMDLSLDTLDARVADSLARVLEREARRNGIDLAESRP